MKGLELAQKYYDELFARSFERDYPEIAKVAAVALAGNGSECFGYDDGLSQDHDWGAGLFILLPQNLSCMAAELDAWQQRLLDSSAFPKRRHSAFGAEIGAVTVNDFYTKLIGFPAGPKSLTDWCRVPEELLAMAVNGKVFADPTGEFSAVRSYLMGYMPEDLRLKRLAACCMALAQTGQYNLPRLVKRDELAGEQLIAARFAESFIHAVFLLERQYMPYYKWRLRALGELGQMGAEFAAELRDFLLSPVGGVRIEKAETLCAKLIHELKNRKLSLAEDDFLASHGLCLQEKISDPFLSSLPAQAMI